MRQARLWRYRRLSGTAGLKQLCVLISPGLQFMAIMAVYFQPLWWILLNYWPLWGRDGFASVLQIAGHHCDIQVKSTWYTEQVLTNHESEHETSSIIIINGWGVLMGWKYNMWPDIQLVKASPVTQMMLILIQKPSLNLLYCQFVDRFGKKEKITL